MDGQSPNFEPQDIPLARVEGAYIELIEHNERHTGMGRAMAGLLGALIRTQDDDSVGVDVDYDVIDVGGLHADELHIEGLPAVANKDEAHLTIKDEGELSKDITAFTVDPVFDEIGLGRLDGNSVVSGNGEAITSAEQTLMINNPTLFVAFLDRAKGSFDTHPALKKLSADVYGRLIGLINSTVGEGVSEEEGRVARNVLVGILERVQPSYRGVKFDDWRVNLPLGESYVNWGKREEFPDYIKARDLGLRELETFSASEWHLDMSGDSYTEHWGALLDHYQGVVDKYGADNDLSTLMNLDLKDCLSSVGDWMKHPTYENDEYLNSLRKAFAQVIARAQKLGLIEQE